LAHHWILVDQVLAPTDLHAVIGQLVVLEQSVLAVCRPTDLIDHFNEIREHGSREKPWYVKKSISIPALEIAGGEQGMLDYFTLDHVKPTLSIADA
jgi:hypothetical protein